MPILRDRPTWFVYVAFFAFGWTFYALGPAFSFLREEQDTSRFVSSLHSLGLATGTLIAGLMLAWLTTRFGRSITLRTGMLFVAAGVAWLCTGPSVWWTVPSVILIGFGGSTLINNGVAFLEAHHGEAHAAAISESTGVSGIANLVAPLGMGLAVGAGFGWRIGMLVAVPMYLLAFFIRFDGSILNRAQPEHHETGGLPVTYWKAWLILVCCFGAEYTIAMWAVDLLQNRGGLSAAAAAAGLAAFTAGITVSRFAGARILQRFDSELVFRGSLLLPALAWFGLWFSTNGVVMLTALALMGAGVGLHFPLNMARMMRASEGKPDRATARSALAASLAAGAAPTGLGALGDIYGIHEAFILVQVFLVVALALSVVWRIPDGTNQQALRARTSQ